jgi:hypothetical protein
MMDKVLKQLKSIKESIDSNISTLKNLVKQSIEFEDLINELAKANASQETKDKFIKIKDEIDKDVDALIKSTQKLFKSYEELVKEMF